MAKNFLEKIMSFSPGRSKKSYGYELAELTPEDISGWDEETMMRNLSRAREAFKRRLQSLERNNLTSYAALQYYDAGAQEVSQMIRSGNFQFQDYSDMDSRRRRNKAYQELMRIQTFFQAKSSERRGIEKINKDQDRRIFGTGKFGRPKYTMTRAERDEFWSIYREYQKTNAEDFFGQGQSEKIQMYIGEIWTRKDFNPADLAAALSKLKARFNGTLEPEKTVDNRQTDLMKPSNRFMRRR